MYQVLSPSDFKVAEEFRWRGVIYKKGSGLPPGLPQGAINQFLHRDPPLIQPKRVRAKNGNGSAEVEKAEVEKAEVEKAEVEKVEAEKVEAEKVEAEKVEAEKVEVKNNGSPSKKTTKKASKKSSKKASKKKASRR